MDIPYCPAQFIGKYFQDHLYDMFTGEFEPAYARFCEQLTCQTYNHNDAALCYILDYTVEETDEALLALEAEQEEECEAYDDEDESDYFPDDDRCGIQFANPGSNSALRAATADNPRDRPCPTCERPNLLTREDVRLGYCCDRCADRAEAGMDY